MIKQDDTDEEAGKKYSHSNALAFGEEVCEVRRPGSGSNRTFIVGGER
jgi:hypothetical protein